MKKRGHIMVKGGSGGGREIFGGVFGMCRGEVLMMKTRN
jgi:hypothetical protein